jgi:hypothetical protein
MLLAIPLFIKQNTGLFFLLTALLCIAYLGARTPARELRRAALLLLAGAATGLILAIALIHRTVGLANYFHWTFQFAASRRLPGLATMLAVYRDPALLWMYGVFALGLVLFLRPPTPVHPTPDETPRSRQRRAVPWLAAALLSLPFLQAFAALFLQQDASDRVEALLHLWPVLLIASLVVAFRNLSLSPVPTIARLIPLILLGAIYGAFLSQQLWGSTYALWPFFVILLATLLAALSELHGCPTFDAAFAAKVGRTVGGTSAHDGNVLPLAAFTALASVVLVTTGAYYALSHERLDYADLSGETLHRSSLPALRGLAMRGDYLPDFEELVAYSNRNIPSTDAILMLPGEDLFYFTTGRTPQFPVLLLDNTVNPYSAPQIVELARLRNVRWLIVKRHLQLQEEPLAFRPQLLQLLSLDFEPAESLNNYTIYHRKQD